MAGQSHLMCVTLSPKQPQRPVLMTYFPVTSLSGTKQVSVHTTKDVVKCVPDHLVSGLSDRMRICLGGRLHLYLTWFICDPIAQFVF